MIKSPIRYVGGKSWLAPMLCKEIEAASPKHYFEPFVGGASIALNVPSYIRRTLSDSNVVLMDLWRCLRDATGPLMDEVDRVVHQYGNAQEGYLAARDEMNQMINSVRPMWIRRSAMFLYLNARCFNGLWRTNGKGHFNVPFGKIERPSMIDRREADELQRALFNTVLFTGGYTSILGRHESALRGAAIYADPPYDETFGDYTKDGFAEIDQRELAENLRWCVARGARVWATNADTPLVREIYSWARVESLEEWHSVGATGARRGQKACVIIRGGM